MKFLFVLFATCLLFSCHTGTELTAKSVTWSFDNLAKVGGHPLIIMGGPRLKNKTVYFDGDGDSFLVKSNPLADVEAFTIEAIVKPYDVFPQNKEPRFLHIESVDNPSRRFTFELRLNENHQWYLDAYIKSEKSQLTLIDSTKTHATGEWAHLAVTYANGVFTSYVNGVKELEGEVDYLPIPANADVSIGARLNQIHWYNGEIKTLRFSPRALPPYEFLKLAK